jgi:L-ascorbate metabolism protein UlaG (beta-lactamase superfamily)
MMRLTDLIRRLGQLRTLDAQRRHDLATAAALNWRRAGSVEGWPDGLELQWLGTAGFRLTHENCTILVDPYLTRPDLGSVLRSRPLVSRADLVDVHVPAADAVLVGHTHFDHALDVGAIARRHGCLVYGSESATRLMCLHGLADKAVTVEAHRTYAIGPFEVTFVPSLHSKLLFGVAVPAGGDLTCDSLDGLGAAAYKCGQVWGIHIAVDRFTLYHQGSANLIEDEIRFSNVDVFLAGIAGRMFTRDYLRRILGALQPRVVVPHHYDDFFRALDAPMGLSFNVNLARFPDEVAAVSSEFDVRALDLLQIVGGR